MVDKTKKQPPIQAAFEKTRSFMGAIELKRKRRRREDRRRLTVKWIGGIFAFVGINGSFVILLHQTGIIKLLIDKWELGYTLSSLIFVAFYFSLAFLLVSTFFWLSDKTGLHYLIEDWVVSWDTWDTLHFHNIHHLFEDSDTWDTLQSHKIHKYKNFPRRKRKGLIRGLKKELDVFNDFKKALEMKKELEEFPDLKKKLDEFPKLKEALEAFNAQLFPFGKEVHDTDDKEISLYDDEELPDSVEGSVERINRVISDLVEEANISSRSLIHQPEHASWKGFVLALEETSSALELELKDIAKYHNKIQPWLKYASNITSKALYQIIDYGDEKKEGTIIKA